MSKSVALTLVFAAALGLSACSKETNENVVVANDAGVENAADNAMGAAENAMDNAVNATQNAANAAENAADNAAAAAH